MANSTSYLIFPGFEVAFLIVVISQIGSMGVSIHCTELLDWITGLTFFLFWKSSDACITFIS